MILDSLMDKEVEKLDDHGSPKVQDLFDTQIWFCLRYLIRQKTTIHSAERKSELLGNWIMHNLKL